MLDYDINSDILISEVQCLEFVQEILIIPSPVVDKHVQVFVIFVMFRLFDQSLETDVLFIFREEIHAFLEFLVDDVGFMGQDCKDDLLEFRFKFD